MMTVDEARGFRAAHDEYARAVWRMTKAKLAGLYRQQLAAQGQQLLYGGPGSKQELACAVMNMRFPVGKLNESVHVLYHAPGETWPACEWCHPHSGEQCECGKGRVTA